MKITVLGSGGWGIALAMAAEKNNNDVTLWSPFKSEVEELKKNYEHKKLLPGIKIPKTIKITDDFKTVENDDLTVMAVPSRAVRETAERFKTVKYSGIIVNVSKGLESGTLLRLSQVIKQEVNVPVVVLSGPSHAEEVSRGIPTSLVATGDTPEVVCQVIKAFSSNVLRIYANDDMVGVELGGALKNVIAVAAGLCDGMGLGDNTKAALITRGLTEIARLGVALGAKERTFAGLTGLGDLVVTCTSKHSRNNRFGNLVGSGIPVDEALERVGTVEGYFATALAYSLAQKTGVEMPITEQCYMVLYKNKNVAEAVSSLMQRPKRDEYETFWI